MAPHYHFASHAAALESGDLQNTGPAHVDSGNLIQTCKAHICPASDWVFTTCCLLLLWMIRLAVFLYTFTSRVQPESISLNRPLVFLSLKHGFLHLHSQMFPSGMDREHFVPQSFLSSDS